MRRGVLAGILLIVAVVCLNYLFVVSKMKADIVRLRIRQKKIEAEILDVRRIIKEGYLIKKKRIEVSAEIEKLKELLPKTEDIPLLVRNIAELARISGVDLYSVDLGRETVYADKHYAVVNIKVSFNSDYSSFRKFLDKVDSIGRLIRPFKLQIESRDKSSKDPSLIVKGLLQTYRYVEKQNRKNE